MSINIQRQLQIQLRDTANAAIWAGAHASPSGSLPANEVACIKNLVNYGIPIVDEKWKPLLAGAGIAATLQGFICHGRPYVRFGNHQKSCELGDFLLVHDHQPNGGALQRRAVIVQAKVFHDDDGVKSASQNPIQLDLYRTWPRFTYTDWPAGLSALSSLLTGKGLGKPGQQLYERDLWTTGATGAVRTDANTLDGGCRYGMIEVDFMGSYWDTHYRRNPWRLCSANAQPPVYKSRSGFKLGTYLARLIRGDTGRWAPVTSWPTDLSATCHWSLLINELISLKSTPALTPVARSLSAAANPQWLTQDRWDGDGKKNHSNGPNNPQKADKIGGEGEGFAIIMLATSGG